MVLEWLKKIWPLIIIIFLGGIVYFSIQLGKPFSDIFNDVAVGLGALLAGSGGLIAFIDWSKKAIRKNEFRKFQIAYPKEKLKISKEDKGTFELLRNPGNGRIYVYDLTMKKKFWIEDMSTYYELGYLDDNNHRDWKDLPSEHRDDYKDFEPGGNILDS